ncbi:aminotransferase class V-fold PLP-dependent enzyme [Candidatus Woesearchaeota archaeon]|jgi:cysteine desulfurase / selenocysteine lyase|nr:aminotransferase class V-fold PLP-dependent enzyme [Candidatus Woesearchaeota archaeon]
MNLKKIRADFPLFERKIRGKPVVYFDNACMSLKPQQVINAQNEYYEDFPGCAGRSAHKISGEVNDAVYKARKSVQKILNSKKSEEIIFTRNTSESINLIAHSLELKKGDIVIQTDKEHNSNLMPWLLKSKAGQIKKIVMKSDKNNEFNLDSFQEKMSNLKNKVKLISMVHSSNLDGTTIPAKEIIKIAHENGALVLLDAAQSTPHKEVNVKKLDVDFLACSGHKMLGPSGIGALYGKAHLLNKLKPFIVGGETVSETTYDSYELEPIPEKFEAGLQNYSGMIGFGAACDYLQKIGFRSIQKQELKLNKLMTDSLLPEIKELTLIGPNDPKLRGGIFNFNVKDMDPHQIAIIMDQSENIMMRSGAHCVHSWFNAHKLNGSARASMYFYNTEEEVELFCETLKKILF